MADDNVGVTMPLPRTRATLDVLRPRIDEVRATVPAPFLLENNVAFIDMVAPRAPNVSGIVFEIFGTWYGEMGPRRLGDELDRMRDVWQRCQQPQGAAA